ncbi:hypothetical protein SAMD00019534_028180 [Acytostelium subglobosum LB1]|uniref:hypothetical protein n=1 Tax=Acytostelium subglobosum LB1 TaxID=1410327 RepID=UPI0006447AAD|nr:hypothetical protein SAMD00019534_028180 [Acytostelium subglobosum LB1]GAM19643.1 hypothetical protein SAMD00019534_028180 [Acytostelium subglobosum LB1]|eukprot:XP_012756405.1 hypothetical protein SAMD00019534_028180 [Acytostelium subglobosum LB1]
MNAIMEGEATLACDVDDGRGSRGNQLLLERGRRYGLGHQSMPRPKWLHWSEIMEMDLFVLIIVERIDVVVEHRAMCQKQTE